MRNRETAVAATVCSFALALPVMGTVRVFVTPASAGYGLTIPENAFVPTYSVTYPNGVTEGCEDFTSGLHVCTSFPPQDAPSGTCANPIVVPPDDFAYIWVQFQNEPVGVKINGLQVMIHECGQSPPASVEVCYYPQCNLEGPPPVNHKRWDGTGTPPDFPEWRQNPQTMVAITNGGLVNLASDPPPGENWNMYDVQAAWGGLATGVALLGAVQAPAGSAYAIDITNISFATPPNPIVASGAFYVSVLGDLNCDHVLDFGDINPFVLALTDPGVYETTYPGCDILNGDINQDGSVDFGDINPFVALLTGK